MDWNSFGVIPFRCSTDCLAFWISRHMEGRCANAAACSLSLKGVRDPYLPRTRHGRITSTCAMIRLPNAAVRAKCFGDDPDARRRHTGPRFYHQEEVLRKIFDRLIHSGESYGQATDAPGMVMATTDEAEFRKRFAAIDNDLREQVPIVREGVQHYFGNGEYPPP
jgi:hypothetical protein